MDKDKIIDYIERSFLSSLLLDDDVTDISYNGVDFYYVSNSRGREKSDIIVDHQTVKDLLRQVANLTEQQFSYTNPNLDVSFGKYRLNATHQSIGRLNDENVVTLSIRKASDTPKITDRSGFLPKEIIELVNFIIKKRLSIVIGGITGTGKTEFQKYLIRKMPANERVIVIDNVMELDHTRSDTNIDLTCWQVDEKNENMSAPILIKNALRNNPDWLIVSEARDKEMIDVLNSALTGAPIITTVHSYDASSLPYRMARLIQRNEQKMELDEILDDLYYHFHFYFYLSKDDSNHHISRYLSEILYIDNIGKKVSLFKNDGKDLKYSKLPKSAISLLEIKDCSKGFKEKFIGG